MAMKMMSLVMLEVESYGHIDQTLCHGIRCPPLASISNRKGCGVYCLYSASIPSISIKARPSPSEVHTSTLTGTRIRIMTCLVLEV